MTTFRFTKQTAIVIEETYEVSGVDEDDAWEGFHDQYGAGDDLDPIHTDTIKRNWEIVNIEEVDE